MNKRRKGTVWIVVGVLLIIAACSLAGYNIYDEARAESVRDSVLSELITKTDVSEYRVDYETYPEIEMPSEEVQGDDYIGLLEIPSLGLQLPVMSEWSYEGLKVAPCRYSGTAYQGSLVIAAHNYECHFGSIKSLLQGDEVIFVDMDGNRFAYEVVEMEILEPTAIKEMVSGDWDLTLFTCNYSGQARVTVRCVEK